MNKFKWAMIFPFYSCKRSYGSTPSGFTRGILSGENHAILQSESLQPLFKNWQHLRKNKLTASTFSLALGFRQGGRVQLWLEKIGKAEPFSGSIATCWSNMNEGNALVSYKLITGNTVSFPEFQIYGKENHEDSWLASSPDGAIGSYIYDLPSYGVLEIKCPLYNRDRTKATPWKRVPLRYIPQAQGLMEILDRDWMDMYVWTDNGSSLFRIERDWDYWNLMKKALSDFWWDHVQPAKEICNQPESEDQASKLKKLRPAPKHELFQKIICESKRVSDNSTLLVREIGGVLQD